MYETKRVKQKYMSIGGFFPPFFVVTILYSSMQLKVQSGALCFYSEYKKI